MNTTSFLENLDPCLTLPLGSPSSGNSIKLRPVTELPPEIQDVFAKFPYFNAVQSQTLDLTFYSDVDLVVSAPTGSGKTVLFELAFLRGWLDGR